MLRDWLLLVLAVGCLTCLTGVDCLPVNPNNGNVEPGNEDTPPSKPLVVNLQIDAELEDVSGLARVTNELLGRNITATVYLTADYANGNAMKIRELYQAGFEIALHGKSSGEQLATMTYEEQLTLLTNAKRAVEGCQPCGTYVPISGFRPQYFSHNEDTFTILDDLGFTYNSGFKAGMIPLEGYENEMVPFAIAGHDFYGVPISVVDGTYLCDMACLMADEMTGEQFGELLQAGVEQAGERDEPLVVLLHGWLVGDEEKYGYWQPFIDMLDTLTESGSTFVTTQELVELYQGEGSAEGQ